MKLRKLLSLILALCLLAALTGCGGSSKESMAYNSAAGAVEAPMAAADMAVAETWAASEEAYDGETGLTMDTGSSQQTPPENRKWIITMNITAETEDLDAMQEALLQQIEELGGYVEHQNQRNGSKYADRRYRYASMTVRIPAAQADSFARNVGEVANVVHSSKNLEDITLSYVATEGRVKALQTEEARLLELMAQAETMSDLLEIESRLTDVRYELEMHTSQLRLYDNQVNYATVYLDIEEVTEYTPVAEQTLWEKVSTGFVRSLKGVGEGAVDLAAWLVINLPYLLVAGGFAFLAVVLFRKLRRKTAVKRALRKAPPKEDGSQSPS